MAAFPSVTRDTHPFLRKVHAARNVSVGKEMRIKARLEGGKHPVATGDGDQVDSQPVE